MISGFKKFAKGVGERLEGPGEAPREDGDKEQSLTTVLPTHEDRASLLILIAESVDAMRHQLTATFEVEEKETDVAATKLAASTSKDELDISKDKAAEGPEEQRAEQAAQDPSKAEKELKKKRDQLRKELAKDKNVVLKDAAVSHFDQWCEAVIERVGEAVNQSGDEAAKGATQKPEASRPPTAEAMADGALISLQKLYPPPPTPLAALDEPHRVLIMHSLLLLLLSLQTYSAESRVLMLRVCSALSISPDTLAEDESTVAKGLLEAAKQQMNADELKNERVEKNSTARKWKVGLGAAAGAVLIGVTGGLAAPLLAAGVGTVMGGLGLGATVTAGYLGALAGSAPLVGILFGAYGGKMTGQMVDEYAKQVEDFAFLPIEAKDTKDSDSRHLRVAILISGWLLDESEVVQPWRIFRPNATEAFALRWELKALLNLGRALVVYVASYAWGWAKKEIISRTIFGVLASALTLPYGLSKATRVVDNPFSVAKSRSDKAGVVLADALVNKVQGERPVTLIAYSLGSRVIYSCLNELAERKALGMVESVCLMGAPVPSDTATWRRIRAIVPGRIINVYSTKDYLLGILYRTSSLQYGVAGLQRIRDVQGIENVDVSDLVDGHTQYRFLVGSIMQKVGLEGIDTIAVEEQMKRFKEEEVKTEQERQRKEAEGKSAEDEVTEMEVKLAPREDTRPSTTQAQTSIR